MNDSINDNVPVRPIERWLGNYSGDHLNRTNQRIHLLCVPAIVWTVIAALWAIPVPPSLGQPGLWAGIALALALSYYWRLSRPLALGLLLVFVLMGVLSHVLYQRLGGSGLRSEEHTSELQSLMRISYAVFCLKKKNRRKEKQQHSNEVRKQHNT